MHQGQQVKRDKRTGDENEQASCSQRARGSLSMAGCFEAPDCLGETCNRLIFQVWRVAAAFFGNYEHPDSS